jgi:hypothetical protein
VFDTTLQQLVSTYTAFRPLAPALVLEEVQRDVFRIHKRLTARDPPAAVAHAVRLIRENRHARTVNKLAAFDAIAVCMYGCV